ncbi:hypothetical protein [uncultured Jannaschia sp.]|uniref:hypothetical protein n=1 Tax=uncultured Jannaschia sp. TaxID=293347 RepID=UPI0026311571|nr:hypothetical protein [uncultured Jannaschia sp.]
MRYLSLAAAALTLTACQPAGPEVEVDAGARMLANACLAEIGQPILPEHVAEDATIELTEAEQAAYAACLQRRS